MKIRLGFVTNSSSSSYLIMTLKSKELTKKMIKATCLLGCSFQVNIVEPDDKIVFEDCGYEPIPEDYDQAIETIKSALLGELEGMEPNDDPKVKEFADSFEKYAHDPNNDIEEIFMRSEESYYGGEKPDDESSLDDLDSDELASLTEDVANSMEKDIESVTREDIIEYIADMDYQVTEEYQYNKALKIDEYSLSHQFTS